MACEYNTNGFCSLWSSDPRPCTNCLVNNADTTPDLRDRIIKGRRRMNEVMLRSKTRPNGNLQTSRGYFREGAAPARRISTSAICWVLLRCGPADDPIIRTISLAIRTARNFPRRTRWSPRQQSTDPLIMGKWSG